MNQLLSIRTNILYSKEKSKDGKETYKKFHELIFLVDKPQYLSTNEDVIVRQRTIEELRFNVSDDAFDLMIKHLLKLKDIDELELV